MFQDDELLASLACISSSEVTTNSNLMESSGLGWNWSLPRHITGVGSSEGLCARDCKIRGARSSSW
jgi:hypothetical protein